jgi:hypothetical protein
MQHPLLGIISFKTHWSTVMRRCHDNQAVSFSSLPKFTQLRKMQNLIPIGLAGSRIACPSTVPWHCHIKYEVFSYFSQWVISSLMISQAQKVFVKEDSDFLQNTSCGIKKVSFDL